MYSMQPMLFHPLGAGAASHWRRLKQEGGPIDAPQGWPVAAVLALSRLLFTPFQAYEEWRYGEALASVRFDQPPLFIIGHWRTGTTLLHNLLCCDPHHGSISTAHALVPQTALTRPLPIEWFLRAAVPERRPMDNVLMALDAPQEEEVALSNLSRRSLYAGWYFPRLMPGLFDRFVLFRGVGAAEEAAWREDYLAVLCKAVLLAPQKRLVLKNPPNTARIPKLLEMFPGAKFVFLQRNPYAVLKSTQRLHRRMIDTLGFQRCGDPQIEEWTLRFYKELLGRYITDRRRLAADALVELRFEDVEQDPMAAVETVYKRLGLEGLEEARPSMEAYVRLQRNYQKNSFQISAEDRALVEKHWGFALDRWGYDGPPR